MFHYLSFFRKAILEKIFLSFCLLVFTVACAAFDDSNNKYNPLPNNTAKLDIPPGLSQPKSSDNVLFNDTQIPAPYKAQKNIRIKQSGSQYWLEVDNSTVDKVWLQVLRYMKDTGLRIKNNDVSKGFLQTDWVYMDTDTPKGSPVRDVFSAIGFKEMYTLNRSYSFNFMVMPSLDSSNKVLIMVTVYQMNEVFDGCLDDQQMTTINSKMATANQRTTWFALQPSSQFTVEVLNNMMVYLGGDSISRKDLNKKPEALPVGDGKIKISDDYQTVWIRTIVALPAIGFTIKSYDLSKGEILVFPTTSESLGTGSKDLSGYVMTRFDNKPRELPNPTYKIRVVSVSTSRQVNIIIEALNNKTDKSSFYLNKLALELYKN
jgi:uncharacterized lipoprotein